MRLSPSLTVLVNDFPTAASTCRILTGINKDNYVHNICGLHEVHNLSNDNENC